MIPPIAIVDSVEMIRDGGSLAATFHGTNGSEYWLLLKITLQELPSGETERTGYANPTLVDRALGTSIDLSWQHAKTLVNQMRGLARDDESLKWLEIMDIAIDQKGLLPATVDRHFG